MNGQFEAAIAVQRWGEPCLTIDVDLAILLPPGVRSEPSVRRESPVLRLRVQATAGQIPLPARGVSTICGIDTARWGVTVRGHGPVGKIRYGGYIFIGWKGDHPPRPVDVDREGKLVVKWDLDNGRPMRGSASRDVRELIRLLQSAGRL